MIFFSIDKHAWNDVVSWAPLQLKVLKFNVDGVARDRTGPTGIGGVLPNCNSNALVMLKKKKKCWDLRLQQSEGFELFWKPLESFQPPFKFAGGGEWIFKCGWVDVEEYFLGLESFDFISMRSKSCLPVCRCPFVIWLDWPIAWWILYP